MASKPCAIVTGASTGIGRGIALKLASIGYDLVVTHLDEPEAMAQTAEQIGAFGGSCLPVQLDLTDAGAPKRLIDEAIGTFGSIEVLVSNAGTTRFGKLADATPDAIDYLYALHYRAPMLLIGLAGRHMAERGVKGRIVQVTSTRGSRAYPADAVYGGMKAALDRSVQSAAMEFAPFGIRVNAVAPGAIQVRDDNPFYESLGPRIPLGRMGQPSDVAEAVAYLCSDAAAYVTGITLRVDGGLILPGMPETTKRAQDDPWGKI